MYIRLSRNRTEKKCVAGLLPGERFEPAMSPFLAQGSVRHRRRRPRVAGGTTLESRSISASDDDDDDAFIGDVHALFNDEHGVLHARNASQVLVEHAFELRSQRGRRLDTRLPCARTLLNTLEPSHTTPRFPSSHLVMAHRTSEAGPSRNKTPETKGLNGWAGASMEELEVDVKVESVSGSADENESDYHDAPSLSPDRKGKGRATSPPTVPRRTSTSEHGSKAKRMSKWADLDLSIIVALVSPIGNWLTGGDHIKNIILIILLIFYLHQIVESTSVYARPADEY